MKKSKNDDKKELMCSDSKVIDDTFICESIIWQDNEFIVASGDYNSRPMVAMRWCINPEFDVKGDVILKNKGFPLNTDEEPVWLTVPFDLVKALKAFFEEQYKQNKT